MPGSCNTKSIPAKNHTLGPVMSVSEFLDSMTISQQAREQASSSPRKFDRPAFNIKATVGKETRCTGDGEQRSKRFSSGQQRFTTEIRVCEQIRTVCDISANGNYRHNVLRHPALCIFHHVIDQKNADPRKTRRQGLKLNRLGRDTHESPTTPNIKHR